jgi:fumarate reductase flavoprotein subunit
MDTLKADVVVLGTGGAGMAAAITAAEGGLKVVVLEKRPFPGGASNTPVGFSYVRNDQAFRDKAFKVHMDMTRWTGNADLVRAWINTSGELPEWVAGMGVETMGGRPPMTLERMGDPKEVNGFPAGYNIGDFYLLRPAGKGHGGSQLIRKMVDRAKELGIDVRMATPAKKILKVGNRITGVYAEDKSGKGLHIEAKAVVIATAGFNDDAEMIKKYGVFNFTLDRFGTCETGDLFFLCPDLRQTGDGIKMAWEVGADKGAMGIAILPHVPGPGILGNMPWIILSQLRIVQEQPYLWVNQQGKRFMDEGLMIDHYTSAGLIARQQGKCALMIFDDDTKGHMEEEGLDLTYHIFPADRLKDIEGDMRKVIAQGNKHVFIADTLEDLSRQADVDYAALKKTIDEYNSCCEKGHDDAYAKDPKYLRPVRKPKFYAVRVFNTAYETIGGVKVNGRAEAMTKDLTVIPGLFAAGDTVAGEIFGDPPTLGGGHLSFALASGRLAGKSALEYAKNWPQAGG